MATIDETTKAVRVLIVGGTCVDRERLAALAALGVSVVVDLPSSAAELAESRAALRAAEEHQAAAAVLEIGQVQTSLEREKEWWRGGNPKRRRR